MKPRNCELCNEEASLYCGSDSAFLCWNCDARVHEANFLVGRHIREVLCCNCKCFAGSQISGSVAPPATSTCRSCSPENPSDGGDSLSSSSMSACVSSTKSCATAPRKVRLADDRRRTEGVVSSSSVTDENCKSPARITTKGKKNLGSCAAEEILLNWSRKFGVNNGYYVASLASPAIGPLMRVVPFRVAVATSFWFALRHIGEGSLRTFQNLRRLEEMSKVPGKVIVAAEEKLARVLRQRRASRELEEGWAEC